jgi:hypothetical protein
MAGMRDKISHSLLWNTGGDCLEGCQGSSAAIESNTGKNPAGYTGQITLRVVPTSPIDFNTRTEEALTTCDGGGSARNKTT